MERNQRKSQVKYFMEQPYVIEIQPIKGGFLASIPLLGRYAVVSDGKTIRKAIKNLNQIKKEWFEIWLERGTTIPVPETDKFENI